MAIGERWHVKPPLGGILEISNLFINKNKGTFITYAGLNEITELYCNNENHRITIINAEPALDNLKNPVEGWAKYEFFFNDYSEGLLEAFEKFSNNSPKYNLVKALKEFVNHIINKPDN